MRRITVAVLLICTIGFISFCLVGCKGWGQTDLDNSAEQTEIDYPTGDTNPEHLAEVLGSYSTYVKFRDSRLQKPTYEKVGNEVIEKCSMQIVYDTIYNPETRKYEKMAWVALDMRGKVVDVKGRIITITNEGDPISLYAWERARIYKFESGNLAEGKFEDIKIGDWLSPISVVVNATNLHLPEARSIAISENPQN